MPMAMVMAVINTMHLHFFQYMCFLSFFFYLLLCKFNFFWITHKAVRGFIDIGEKSGPNP